MVALICKKCYIVFLYFKPVKLDGGGSMSMGLFKSFRRYGSEDKKPKVFFDDGTENRETGNRETGNVCTDDPEYGYSASNPIFVNGFGPDRKYLAALRTVNGDPVRFRRVCPVSVKGICGLVDLYDIYIPAEGWHTKLYICNYGNTMADKAPRGFTLSWSE